MHNVEYYIYTLAPFLPKGKTTGKNSEIHTMSMEFAIALHHMLFP
jgi:hypothetical protein